MGAKRASKNAKQRAREGKEGAALPGGGRGLERGGGNHTLEVLRSLPPDGCSLTKVVVLKIGALILIEFLPKFTICYKSTYYSTPCSICALRLVKNCYLIAGRWWFLKMDFFFILTICTLQPETISVGMNMSSYDQRWREVWKMKCAAALSAYLFVVFTCGLWTMIAISHAIIIISTVIARKSDKILILKVFTLKWLQLL